MLVVKLTISHIYLSKVPQLQHNWQMLILGQLLLLSLHNLTILLGNLISEKVRVTINRAFKAVPEFLPFTFIAIKPFQLKFCSLAALLMTCCCCSFFGITGVEGKILGYLIGLFIMVGFGLLAAFSIFQMTVF